jgi:hypothetical protein
MSGFKYSGRYARAVTQRNRTAECRCTRDPQHDPCGYCAVDIERAEQARDWPDPEDEQRALDGMENDYEKWLDGLGGRGTE